MSKVRTKLLIFLLFSPVLLLLVLLIFWGVSQFLASFNKGADPASIFRGNLLIVPEVGEARWLSAAPPQGIAPSKAQQEELIAAYWQGWQALSRAHLTGQTTDLSTYWASPTLETIENTIDPAGGIEHRTHHHKLRLTFFSDDRSVATLHDRFILEQNNLTLTVDADVTLTLDGSRWRIRYVTMEYSMNN